MSVRPVSLAKCLVACLLLTACGGMSRHLVFKPLGPPATDQTAALGHERNSGWHLDLGAAEIHIAPVVVASKLTWVFGPLVAFPTFWEDQIPREGFVRIGVFVTAKERASVSFDPRKFVLVMQDGRTLSPNGAAPSRSPSSRAEPLSPVELSNGQTWRKFLEYDALLADLTPFTLRLGELGVEGKPFQLPPIPFVRATAYWSS